MTECDKGNKFGVVFWLLCLVFFHVKVKQQREYHMPEVRERVKWRWGMGGNLPGKRKREYVLDRRKKEVNIQQITVLFFTFWETYIKSETTSENLCVQTKRGSLAALFINRLRISQWDLIKSISWNWFFLSYVLVLVLKLLQFVILYPYLSKIA